VVAQCVAFGCRARKPFHPQKLYDLAVKNFLLQETELYEDVDTEEKDKVQEVSARICTTTAIAMHQLVCMALQVQLKLVCMWSLLHPTYSISLWCCM